MQKTSVLFLLFSNLPLLAMSEADFYDKFRKSITDSVNKSLNDLTYLPTKELLEELKAPLAYKIKFKESCEGDSLSDEKPSLINSNNIPLAPMQPGDTELYTDA